jgi:hypothetical protein
MTLRADLSQLQTDAALFHDIVHGPATGDGSTVTTEAGSIPTLAKQAADIPTSGEASFSSFEVSSANNPGASGGAFATLETTHASGYGMAANWRIGTGVEGESYLAARIRAENTGVVEGENAGGRLSFELAATGSQVSMESRMVLDGGSIRPGADNAVSLGSASFRASVVYAATGTINTSDASLKTAVSALTAQEIAAAKRIASEIGTFQWLDSVAEKGADIARRHVGLTVQRAIAIMEDEGLAPYRYAFICRDTVEGGLERYAFRYDQLALFLVRGLDARLTALEA